MTIATTFKRRLTRCRQSISAASEPCRTRGINKAARWPASESHRVDIKKNATPEGEGNALRVPGDLRAPGDRSTRLTSRSSVRERLPKCHWPGDPWHTIRRQTALILPGDTAPSGKPSLTKYDGWERSGKSSGMESHWDDPADLRRGSPRNPRQFAREASDHVFDHGNRLDPAGGRFADYGFGDPSGLAAEFGDGDGLPEGAPQQRPERQHRR